MAITQITTRDTQLEKQRLGRDVTMIENDGGTLKVSVGSVVECSGAIYEVTSAAETPTGSPADGTYLFFDPAGPSFAWSAVAGTYSAAKGGIYDGSDRRQCRFRLNSGTTWDQLVMPEAVNVAIDAEISDLVVRMDAEIKQDLIVDRDFTVERNVFPQTPASSGTWNVAVGTFIVPRGVYLVIAANGANFDLEILVAATWRGAADVETPTTVFSDGVNVRFNNTDSISLPVYYLKF